MILDRAAASLGNSEAPFQPRVTADSENTPLPSSGQAMGNLLDQWKLVRAASRDRRLSRGDIAVLVAVVDNYYQRHGNSRAAHSYLAAGTGLSKRAVITSIKRLCTLGYLGVARLGCGTRPTEYLPNWPMHANFTSISGEGTITPEVSHASPQAALEVKANSPKPAYVAGLQAGLRKQGPAPRAPLGGLIGAPASPARDRFDELWDAYGRKHERSKAKAEYRKLDPGASLHARLVRAAADWTAAYEAQERPIRFRKYLHTWLAGECWYEDGPEPYDDPKAVTVPARRKRPADLEDEYRTWLQRSLLPGGRILARFIDWVECESSRDRVVYDFDFAALQGSCVIGRFVRSVVAPSDEFDQLCAACGDELALDDYPGKLLWVTMGKNGSVGYEPYAEHHPGRPQAASSSSEF